MTKKFDFVFGNPPYDGNSFLHQKIFNESVKLVNDDGYLVFVQPASPYQNKKKKKNKAEEDMIKNILKYLTNVKIHPGTVFTAAGVMTDVAITTLQKTKSIPVINEITYKNGDKFENVKIDDINIAEFPPDLYVSISSKIKKICEDNGSVGDNMTKKGSSPDNFVFLSKVRGHPNDSDFFTIVPKKSGRSHYINAENKGFGVFLKKEFAENFYDYCESYVARIGLATLKFNQHLNNGELNLVPMCDFSRTYTDVELYQMVGLTEEEINAIENFLPDYYGRKA